MAYYHLTYCDDSSKCSGELYVTTYDGSNWGSPVIVYGPTSSVSQGPPTAVGSITYDPINHRLVYAIARPDPVVWDIVVKQSTDGGATWTWINSNPATYSGTTLQFGNIPGNLFIRYIPGSFEGSNFFISFSNPSGNLAVAGSSDGITWGFLNTSGETSYFAPFLSYNPAEGLFHLTWSGEDNNRQINDLTSSQPQNWSNKQVFEETPYSPGVAFFSTSNVLFLFWTGNECCNGIGHLNVEEQNAPVDGAQFVSQTGPPGSMRPSQQAPVTVTMKNTGTTMWTPPSINPYNPFRLGTQNPRDNTNWGFNRVDLTSSVAPGSQYTFTFTITAPSTTGTYNFQWEMVQELVTWFGDLSPNLQVQVAQTATTVEILIYPTTDHYCRSIGLAIDRPLPVPWWPPYNSGYEIGTPSSSGGQCSRLDYYTHPYLAGGSHYLQVAASGTVPSYAWHAQVYVNGNEVAQGDVGRNQILQANFSV